MARRRGKQLLVHVKTRGIQYGFRTTRTVHNGYKTELGQTEYESATGVLFGANSPKPARATKEFEGQTISSFCSDDKITSLRKANWNVSNNGRIRGISGTGKTKTLAEICN